VKLILNSCVARNANAQANIGRMVESFNLEQSFTADVQVPIELNSPTHLSVIKSAPYSRC